MFEAAGTLNVVYGVLAIHRRAHAAGEPWTVRPRCSPNMDGSCFEWAFHWRQWSTRPTALEELSRLKPRLASHLRVTVTHRVRDGQLVPAEYVLSSERPFPARTIVEFWVVPVMAECDGKRTTAQIYQAARATSAVPEPCSLTDFTKIVAMFIERGYLEVDDSQKVLVI
jgi:hypothetical protein